MCIASERGQSMGIVTDTQCMCKIKWREMLEKEAQSAKLSSNWHHETTEFEA